MTGEEEIHTKSWGDRGQGTEEARVADLLQTTSGAVAIWLTLHWPVRYYFAFNPNKNSVNWGF